MSMFNTVKNSDCFGLPGRQRGAKLRRVPPATIPVRTRSIWTSSGYDSGSCPEFKFQGIASLLSFLIYNNGLQQTIPCQENLRDCQGCHPNLLCFLFRVLFCWVRLLFGRNFQH